MSPLFILDSNKDFHSIDDPILWAKWMKENYEDRIVKKTYIDQNEISTVFLGIDHNYTIGGFPILFETMVFGPIDSENKIQRRYITFADALKGHEAIVEKIYEKSSHS